jgi:hypothetical protein
MTRRTISTAAVAAAVLFTATAAHAGGRHGYGYPYRSHHHHHHNGLAIALGVTGALVGTAILVDAFSRPRYVERPVYYYPPPAPPPPAASSADAYAEGYRAGLAEAQRYEEGRRRAWDDRIDYGLGGRRPTTQSDDPYYGR